MSIKIGDKVVFGRGNGQQTTGTVIKINASSVKVRQDEARGGKPIGTEWRVHPSLVSLVSGTVAAPVAVAVAVAAPVVTGFRVGDRATFTAKGRTVTGTVTRVNTKSVSLENCDDGSRGWRVAPGMLRAANAAAPAASAPASLRPGTPVEYMDFVWSQRGMAPVTGVVTKVVGSTYEVYGNGRTRIVAQDTVKAVSRRNDDALMSECLGVYSLLSPENLTADGERPRSAVIALSASLNRALRALWIEAGREITEDKAWQWEQTQRKAT